MDKLWEGTDKYIDARDGDAAEVLGLEIYRLGAQARFEDIVVLCVGSDRATGDSLGPLAGQFLLGRLKEMCDDGGGVKLYGTLENPVHARNLEEALDGIKKTAREPLVIAIDACLGDYERIGFLRTGKGSLLPGSGLKKTLPPVGDMFVTGIVNASGAMEPMVLQSTRLAVVMAMSRVISRGVCFGVKMLRYEGHFRDAVTLPWGCRI